MATRVKCAPREDDCGYGPKLGSASDPPGAGGWKFPGGFSSGTWHIAGSR